MARYTYNAGLVTQTIDTLYNACDCLDSTNVDIKKGIDMIYNARGAENMNIDFSVITGYHSTVIDAVEKMAGEIKKKANEIEEYQDAPWYKKLFATIGMGALKLVEGLATFVENIGDGLVSIVGFVGGIFSSKFKDSVAEFVRTDYVGETTAKWYEEGWLKDVNKYSYMSHESTAANILKGVGTAAGYVILTVCTAGAGTAVSLGVSAAAAAAGGIGSGTQQGLKEAQLMNPEMSAGDAFNSAFAKGVKQGATAAATTLITAGLAKGLGNMAGQVAGGADELAMFTKVVDKADDAYNAMNAGQKLLNGAKGLVNKGANIVFNNGVGRAVLNTGSNVVGKIPPSVLNAAVKAGPGVAGAVGAAAGGQFKANEATVEINEMIEEQKTPSVAEQLYTDSQDVLNDEDRKTTAATEEEAKENLEKLKEEGYEPGSGSPDSTPSPTVTPAPGEEGVTPTPTGAGTTPRPTGTGSGPKPTVTAPEITMPTPTATAATPAPTTPVPTPTTNDPIVSNIDPVKPTQTPKPTTPTGPNTLTEIKDDPKIEDKGTVSSEVLNTFGESAGSLSGLSGSKTNIPSSSSPILSSNDGSSSGSSFVPLGAGLGAASLAGIGAKAVIDKREKAKSEEDDELETEEWATQDDVEIDYGMDTSSEEADYLSPTDELAFTE